jgi:SAM-dependent methyltransferase
MNDDKKLNTVAKFWDQRHSRDVATDYWTSHPIISQYVHSIIAPDSSTILEWFAKNFAKGKTFERGISLGCGTGAAERQALEIGLCRSIDGFDISRDSVEAAKQEAVKAGMSDRIQYSVVDINSITLPKRHYDFALCIGSLHHVEKLEHVINELKTCLKQGAYFLINEYVGPSRLQWTGDQLDILNRVWEAMPSEYRRPGPLLPIDEQELIKVDPSEAVRSSEIISFLYNNFEIVADIQYGGSFLMPFWHQGIRQDIFLKSPTIDRQVIVKLLCVIEELILDKNLLPSCYAQIVACNNLPTNKTPLGIPLQNYHRRNWTDFWMNYSHGEREIKHELFHKAVFKLRTEGVIAFLGAVARHSRKFLLKK